MIPEVKEAIEARAFIAKSVLARLDECFRILGESQCQLSVELREIATEDFRKEFIGIQSPLLPDVCTSWQNSCGALRYRLLPSIAIVKAVGSEPRPVGLTSSAACHS